MSEFPYMPFYVGDYLGDTGHLDTLEHGAYCLLIFHYCRHRRQLRCPVGDVHIELRGQENALASVNSEGAAMSTKETQHE